MKQKSILNTSIRKHLLLCLSAILLLSSTKALSVTDETVQGKIIAFEPPYSKLLIDIGVYPQKDIHTYRVSVNTNFLSSKGNKVGISYFESGQTVQIVLEKVNNKYSAIEIKDVYIRPTIGNTFNHSFFEKSDRNYFKRYKSFSIGKNIGSSLAPYPTYDKSKLGFTFLYENRLRGTFLSEYVFYTYGIYYGRKKYRDNYSIVTDSYLTKLNYTIIGLRFNIHLRGTCKQIKRWDPYVGTMASLNIARKITTIIGTTTSSTPKFDSQNSTTTKDFSTDFSMSYYVGSRFYLTKHFALYAEGGYGISYFNFGITYNK